MHGRFNLLVGLAVLGVLGMLSVLGFVITQSEASSLNAGDLTLGETKTETFNPIVDTGHTTGPGAGKVTGYTVTSAPTKALALATYTLEFQVPHDLANGVDEIIVTWVDDFADIPFPTLIANSAVSIRAVGTGAGCGGAGTEVPTCGVTGPDGNEGQAVSPEEVNVTTVGVKPFYQTRLRIPDMDTDDNSGGNGIKKDATVTVVFRQAAGIHNPKEVGDYEVWVRVTDGSGNDPNGAADDTEDTIFVQARLLADSDDGKRGNELTLVA